MQFDLSQQTDNDEIIFVDDVPEEHHETKDRWYILIVDDEDEVHKITRMVLEDFTFEGKPLALISAYSAEEAREILKDRFDISVILLDVVMETGRAGLELARHIREDLQNNFIRIILRTGQPGQAPERKVVAEYDINDYKQKTELTAQKLFTTITAAIRSYRDLRRLEANQRGLENVIESSRGIFRLQSIRLFSRKILSQIGSIVPLKESSVFFYTDAHDLSESGPQITAATGRFADIPQQEALFQLADDVQDALFSCLMEKITIYNPRYMIIPLETGDSSCGTIYAEYSEEPDKTQKALLSIFTSNASVALDNINLNNAIEATQREILYTLGEVVENRSQEAANHVKRVAEYSYILAIKGGLSRTDAELLRRASPMHDIGKIGIPDDILLKPGRLTSDEFAVIKTHTDIGYNILRNSKRPLLRTAAVVAYQHHERWDGKGYPRGLAGQDIHIFGRITAIADVFDALICKRVYKEPWPIQKILEHFKSQSGLHFDPELMDIFIENLDLFLEVKANLPDE
ncbi:MAG: DUF3369 domain-containing protein [Desulfovibrio sp.]